MFPVWTFLPDSRFVFWPKAHRKNKINRVQSSTKQQGCSHLSVTHLTCDQFEIQSLKYKCCSHDEKYIDRKPLVKNNMPYYKNSSLASWDKASFATLKQDVLPLKINLQWLPKICQISQSQGATIVQQCQYSQKSYRGSCTVSRTGWT